MADLSDPKIGEGVFDFITPQNWHLCRVLECQELIHNGL